MKDKNSWRFIILILCFSYNSIYSQNSFNHPLMINSGDLYRYININYYQIENKTPDVYERDRSINLAGEYRLLNNFAITASSGRTKYEKTDTEPIQKSNRFQLGLKVAHKWKNNLLTGAFAKYYKSDRGAVHRQNENPDLFFLEAGLSFGYKIKKFEFISNILINSESNAKFKEKFGENFHRHYQFEFSISRKIIKSGILFIETSYREPYNKIIDTNTRFWYLYPGVTYDISFGRLGISLQTPVLVGGLQDRGGKLTYMYFF